MGIEITSIVNEPYNDSDYKKLEYMIEEHSRMSGTEWDCRWTNKQSIKFAYQNLIEQAKSLEKIYDFMVDSKIKNIA